MTLVEANELFSCMNFSLEESEERALESAQQKVSFLVSMESLIDHDSEYSSAMEGALDTIKNAMKKVKEAFHKLIIKFGLIVRNFQHRAQAKTLASDILLLGNRGLEVPAALLGKIYELKDAFNAVGLKDSWKTETQGSMFDYNASRILTLPEIKRNIRDITSKHPRLMESSKIGWIIRIPKSIQRSFVRTLVSAQKRSTSPSTS